MTRTNCLILAASVALTASSMVRALTNPVLEYTFETPTPANPTVFDTSGNGNNSTISGNLGYDTYRQFGARSMGFPDTGGSYLTTSQPVPFANQFTLFTYVATSESTVPILSSIDPNNGYSFALSNGRLTFQAGQLRGAQSDPQSFSFGAWNSVAVTVDKAAQSLNLYYNGLNVPITNYYGNNNASDLFNFQSGGTHYVGGFWNIFQGGSKYLDQVQVYDQVLSQTQIARLTATGSLGKPAAPALITLPAAKLAFSADGDTGTTITNAGTTGIANNGALQGTAQIVSNAAATGPNSVRIAASPGDVGRIDIGNYALSDVSTDNGDATFAAWVKAGSSSDIQMIFANANAFPFGGFKLFVATDRTMRLEIGNGSGVAGFQSSSLFPDDGKFHHVTATIQKSGDQFGNTYASIYIDGVDVTASGGVAIGSTSGLQSTQLGGQDSGSEPFPLIGNLDDVRAYSGRLTAEQVRYLGAARWANDSGGNWSDPAAWNGTVPTGAGSAARLGDRVTSARTVNMDGPQTVGILIVDPGQPGGSYTVAGGSTLTFDRGSGVLVQNFSGNNTISAPVVFNNSTTFDIALGSSLSFTGTQNSDGTNNYLKSGGGTLNLGPTVASGVQITGGTLAVRAGGGGSHNRLAADTVTIAAGGTLAFTPSPQTGDVSVLGGVSINTGATLDVGTTDIVVRGTSAGDAASKLAALETAARVGQQGDGVNLFNSTGLTSSTAAADAGGLLRYAVAVVPNSYNGTAIYDTFDGLTVSQTDVLIKFTYFGDADLSGSVDDTDFFLANNGFLNNLSGWLNGDFDYTGAVDDTDFFLLNNGYLNQGGSLRTGSGVPEPRIVGMLVLGAAWSLRRGDRVRR